MTQKIRSFAASLFLLAFVSPQFVSAQTNDELVSDDKPKDIKKKDGWDFILVPGASVSMSDNRSVVGQLEGLTATIGINLKAGAAMRSGKHQFRTGLDLTEAFTRNPIIDQFVKSTDILKFEAMYKYDLLSWLGPYARFGLSTTLLEGFSVRADNTRWVINRTDGTQEFQRWATEFRLTDGFKPLQLRESVGFFVEAFSEKWLAIEFRAGFGGLHLLADGQLAFAEEIALADGRAQVLLTELASFNQAGIELGASLSGEAYEKKLVYSVGLEVLMPVIYALEDGDDRGTLDLTNIELNAGLSYKMLKWLSLDYVFRLVHVPQLIDEIQIQNNLLLTASWTLFEPAKEEK